MTARILIVDDHEIVRQGVRSILANRPDWEICGEASNGQEAVDAVSSLHPDLVVLDITMPQMSGLEAASRISQLSHKCPVLIFTMHESAALVADIRRSGAQGYVQKSQAARDLIHAIETLLGGNTFFAQPSDPKSPAKGTPKPGFSFRIRLSWAF
ncbi:MAG TPA: response regulator transcription factor [Candidatus Acidoferrum sp.]